MKFVVMSDTHGNLARIQHVLGFALHAHADGIIHCGDWDNEESAKLLQECGLPVYAILGNADEPHANEIWKLLKETPGEEDVDVLETTLAQRKVAVAHQPFKVKKQIVSGQFDAIFHGHTHQVRNEFNGKTLILNPGALHRTPQPTFAVYDTDTNSAVIIEIPF